MREIKFRAWVNETINYDGKLIKKEITGRYPPKSE